VVPIVPSAILIDLWFGGDPKIRPGADCGYRAAQAATNAPVQEGNVGAGAGATVGKSSGVTASGNGGPMKAGVGAAAIKYPNGLVVAAIVAVNAFGDVIDPMTGSVVAGVRGPDGKLADVRKRIRDGSLMRGRAGANTSIGVVSTTARLPETARPGVPWCVAAGDVASGRALVWSRTDRPARMFVEYATSDRFADARRVRGPVAFDGNDYTARTVLTGLPQGQRIFYRVQFEDL